jgi:hypothetical protein
MRIDWWILRVAACMCYIGHGAFGLLTKEEWLPFFGVVGIPRDAALALMPLIGAVDVALGIAVLWRPTRVLFVYMAAWALWTAALRPLAGGSAFELVERAGNYGVPLALLLVVGPGRVWRDWVTTPTPSLSPTRSQLLRRALMWTTALLLFGHGALVALEGKQLLARHFAVIGLGTASATAAGWAEMALAFLLLARPHPALLLAVALWKGATELLYPLAGAPIWEFIERGGSYGAPLALALLLPRSPVHAAVSRLAMVLVMSAVAVTTPLSAQQRVSDSGLVDLLRRGGYALVFRHTATDHDATDRGPDRASQRNLTDEGAQEARAIGAAIRSLGIPIGDVRANPMYRNRETAEHAFGRATVDSTLAGSGAVSSLRAMLGTPVSRGANRVIVTRIGILSGAFEGYDIGPIDEGDCIVVEPLSAGQFHVVAHLKAMDWGRLHPSAGVH